MRDAVNKKKEIIQDISVYSTSVYIGQVSFFLRGFLNASIVGPSMYGLWSALNIILSFGFYAPLGIVEGMNKEIPYSIGKGENKRADIVRSNAFGFSLVMSILIAIFIIAFALFFGKSIGRIEQIGLFTVGVLIVAQNTVNFYEGALSSVKRFSIIAVSNVFFPIICVGLTFLAVPLWKIYGIYIIAIFGPLAMALFYQFKARYKPCFRFDIKEIARLLKIGFPWMSLSLFPVILFAIDRTLIFRFLGAAELGYYALGLLICKFLYYLPGVIGKVVEPRLFNRYGERERVEDLNKYLFVPTKAMAVSLPLFIGIVYFASALIVRHFMLEYLNSLRPIFILLFGKFFLLFAPTVLSFFVALNKHQRIVNFYLVAIVLSALADIAILRSGLGLIGVASVTAIVSFLLGTALFIYAAHMCLKTWRECFITSAKMYIPYVCILSAAIALNFIFKGSRIFLIDLLLVLLEISVLILVSMPFILYLNRQIKLFEEVATILRSRLGISFFRQHRPNVSLMRSE